MTPTEQKLRDLLNELFRFDRSDLDFGIYRIMNLKRDQVQHFIDVDLLPQIHQVLEQTDREQNGDLAAQLEKARDAAKAAGLTDPDEAPKVKELLGKYKTGQSTEEQERQVFGHLFEFFRRYYKDGDFIPQARYKKGVYALPYEGEEVKLSWANQDQYYIKSSDELRDYSFTLSDKRLVHFRVIQAEVDRDNNKAQQDKDRRLILASDNPVTEENGELVIRFEYRPDENARKQDEINDSTVAAVVANPTAAKWKLFLQAQKPGSDKGVLAYHLRQYTARNTFDYFIHKDLGGFLRRELDFYLKNEVLDFDTLSEQGAQQSLQRQFGVARAAQQVGGKVIDFLAQLENFQKKLWLKKKFVVRTDWCVTLDRVPHELYAQVAANSKQVEEWKRLFAVQDIAGDTTTPGFTEPPSIAFLEHNPYLVLDTRFFVQAFKDTLLASFSDLDEQTDGLLIHSENFQALELLQERYREQVKCVYIDPPYNTGSDGFAYKDNYQHSTWASMVADRSRLACALQSDSSAVFASMDDGEQFLLRGVMSRVYGERNFVNNIIWQKKFSPSNDATWLSDNHDFIVTFAKNKATWRPGLLDRSAKAIASYINPDNDPRGVWTSGDLSVKTYSAATDYPITTPSGRVVNPPQGACWRVARGKLDEMVADNRIWFGPDGDSTPRVKRFLSEVKRGVTPLTLWTYQEVGHNQEAKQRLLSFFDPTTGPTSEELSVTTPKPERLLSRIVTVGNVGTSGLLLDYFAGSGTTAHAVINLNREDDGHRKYILVEMGDYFDTVLKPRIEKVIYSKDWKDGKPISREGSSHMFKYMTLESYDDTLANLELKPEGLFEGAPQAHEQYMLRYMLDAETQGSPSLLNTAAFDNPFAYTLKVAHGSETVETTVDLVETFNYLIGLRVRKADTIRGVRVVQGVSPTGERVLVLWRNVRDTNADQLNEWFTKQGYNTRDTEFDVIYVNSDNHLQNLRRADQTWKVRLIEPEFQRLMFDVQDV
jgi:adenine-specific DNA-methyltransferase